MVIFSAITSEAKKKLFRAEHPFCSNSIGNDNARFYRQRMIDEENITACNAMQRNTKRHTNNNKRDRKQKCEATSAAASASASATATRKRIGHQRQVFSFAANHIESLISNWYWSC